MRTLLLSLCVLSYCISYSQDSVKVNAPIKYTGVDTATFTDSTLITKKYLQSVIINSGIGNGTANYLPRWIGSSVLGNSIIRDNGTYVGIGQEPDSPYVFSVKGTDTIMRLKGGQVVFGSNVDPLTVSEAFQVGFRGSKTMNAQFQCVDIYTTHHGNGDVYGILARPAKGTAGSTGTIHAIEGYMSQQIQQARTSNAQMYVGVSGDVRAGKNGYTGGKNVALQGIASGTDTSLALWCRSGNNILNDSVWIGMYNRQQGSDELRQVAVLGQYPFQFLDRKTLDANMTANQHSFYLQKVMVGSSTYSENGSLLYLNRNIQTVTAENGRFLTMNNGGDRVVFDKNGSLSITPGIAKALTLSGTLSATVTQGSSSTFTTPAGTNNAMQGAAYLLNSGYNGTGIVAGVSSDVNTASTGTNLRLDVAYANPIANAGLNSFSRGTTTGTNIGGYYDASNGNRNIGVIGKAVGDKASAVNIGVLGTGYNPNATSPVMIGGYFGLINATPTFTSAALVANNGTQALPIFKAQDNGTDVFTIGDGGDITSTANLKLTTAGKGIQIKEGANATMGTTTLNAGTATVSTTAVTANSRIFLTLQNCSNCGVIYISARSAGASFTISSNNIADSSVVAWLIIEPS